MKRNRPWDLPPGPERRELLRRLGVSITAEDYTDEELARQEASSPTADDDARAASPGSSG